MNSNVTEKYALFLFKEKKKLTDADAKPFVIGSMILEMVENNEIEMNDDEKIKLKDKEPNITYRKSLYKLLEDKKEKKLSYKDFMRYIVNGYYDKEIKDILNDLQNEMQKKKLITINTKKGIFRPKKVVNVVDEKFKAVIEEFRDTFLSPKELSNENIMLGSLLHTSGIIKKAFNKYENDQLKNQLSKMKDSYYYDKIKAIENIIIDVNSNVIM